MIADILLIAVIAVTIIDIAQFPFEIEKIYWRWLFRNEQVKPDFKPFNLRPFTCSLCTSFWTSIIYLLITSQLSLFSIAITLIISVFTPQIADFIRLCQDAVTTITEGLRKIFRI